jgi:hypothetical protein
MKLKNYTDIPSQYIIKIIESERPNKISYFDVRIKNSDKALQYIGKISRCRIIGASIE